MVNTNTTPQEHNTNITNYIDLTSEIVFENQEKLPNGDFVEMCRMMREMKLHLEHNQHTQFQSSMSNETRLMRQTIQNLERQVNNSARIEQSSQRQLQLLQEGFDIQEGLIGEYRRTIQNIRNAVAVGLPPPLPPQTPTPPPPPPTTPTTTANNWAEGTTTPPDVPPEHQDIYNRETGRWVMRRGRVGREVVRNNRDLLLRPNHPPVPPLLYRVSVEFL